MAPIPAVPTKITPQEALQRTIEHREIFHDEMLHLMRQIMSGDMSPVMMAALITGLRVKKETIGEITAAAQVMREFSTKVEVADKKHLVDIVGTGGDGSGTFNISTTAAIVVAACGVPVAKHGNRAITSKSGSADVLDALGIRIDHDAVSAAVSLREHGFAFLFAPLYHPAMRHAGPTRREIGVRTAFNLLGPLTNPAGAQRGLIGVGDEAAAPKVAEVLRLLGAQRMLVVHGAGVDELTLDGTAVLYDVTPDGINMRRIDPAALGLQPAKTAAISGGDPATNARIVEGVLRGEPGARRDVVLLNAGAALVAAGVVDRIEDGIDRAALTIDAGLASELLGALRAERKAADAAAAVAAKATSSGNAASAGAPA